MKNLSMLVSCLVFVWWGVALGESVRYEVGGEVFEGYYVSPAKDAPLVFLVHDWDGLTDYEVRRAGMLAELGYAVFAADLFGAGVRPEAISERRRLTAALYDNRERLRGLLHGALQAAADHGANTEHAVAMGYCFGGTAVLELARSGADLRGFVPFHGALGTPEGQSCAAIKGKVLVFHGTADESITMEDFAGLAQALESHGVPHEMITYGGAPHAFTVFGSDRYREDADKASWHRFTSFLAETLKPRRE